MFDSKRYMPILKWKRAEQGALKELSDDLKESIMPIIELVMPKPKSLYKDEKKQIKNTQEELLQEVIEEFRVNRIPQITKEILESCGKQPVLIDFSLLFTEELKVDSIIKVLASAKENNAQFIPIFNLSDGELIKKEIKQALKKYGNGVCIRIALANLNNIDELNSKLNEMLEYLDIKRKEADLLVDLKDKYDSYEISFDQSQKIEKLEQWRSYIFACGAFPENLIECKVDEETLIPRAEWACWLEIRKKSSKRIPIFSDYTVRSPIYDARLQFYHPTSSIKYALEKNWLILKGKKKAFGMYLASAALLVKDERFYGEKFSEGSKFIADKAKHFEIYNKNPKVKGTGSTETWLKALINHHITLTAHQLSKLAAK